MSSTREQFVEGITPVGIEVAKNIPEVGPVMRTAEIAFDLTFYGSILGLVITCIFILSAIYCFMNHNTTGVIILSILSIILGPISLIYYNKTRVGFTKYIANTTNQGISALTKHVGKIKNLFKFGEGELDYFTKKGGNEDNFIGDTIRTIGSNEDDNNFYNEDGCDCNFDRLSTGGAIEDINESDFLTDDYDNEIGEDLLPKIKYNSDHNLRFKQGLERNERKAMQGTLRNIDTNFVKVSKYSGDNTEKYDDLSNSMKNAEEKEMNKYQNSDNFDFSNKKQKKKHKGRRRKKGGEEFTEIILETDEENKLLEDLDEINEILNLNITGETPEEILENMETKIDQIELTLNRLNFDQKEELKKVLSRLRSESVDVTKKIDKLKDKIENSLM